MPGAPLLRRTCASAFLRLSRSTTLSIDGSRAAGLSLSARAALASVPPARLVRASPVPFVSKASSSWVFCRLAIARSPHDLPLHCRSGLRRHRLLCPRLTSAPRSRALRLAQSGVPDTAQTSRGKLDRLPRTPAGFTTPALDSIGLRDHMLARPTG
jgi:hypothetical protein